MSSWGTTSITVTGPQTDRAALHAALVATATGTFAFSLVRAAPEIWCGDGLLRIAEMAETEDTLLLKMCMAYDGDCLPLAESLAQRYPALRFEAWFDCEGTWPEFTVSVHEKGVEVCHAWFETTHLASLVINPAEPRNCSAVVFYEQTPGRDLAAASCLGDCLDLFCRRPDLVAGWRRSDDGAASLVYLMPDADEAGHLVLALDVVQGSASLLRNVNQFGGYSVSEQLSLDQVRTRMPELGTEIDRALLGTAADRMQHMAWQMQQAGSSTDDHEIPF